MLAIQDLHKVYPTGDRALESVTLTLDKDQILSLIGPSGAGKSTLIRCVNRLVEPTSGSIALDGVELTHLSGKDLRRQRRHIGMIFQEYALVERITVMENVLAGKLGYLPLLPSLARRYPAAMVDEALSLLDEVGLADQAEKRADELSGGQRQRVGIVRALMQEPRLLLVDEPTASLDPKTARTIMRLITRMARDRHLPAIINMHDVALAKLFATRIVGLRAGSVVFDGPPDRLSTDVLTTIYGEEDWTAGTDDDQDPVHSGGDEHPEHTTSLLMHRRHDHE
jgi:phosphonate transport system ATP-binding protein